MFASRRSRQARKAQLNRTVIDALELASDDLTNLIALKIYRRWFGDAPATLDDLAVDPMAIDILLGAGGISAEVARHVKTKYVWVRQGPDGSLTPPLYQHTCGAIEPRYPPEVQAEVGDACTACGSDSGDPADWRALYRTASDAEIRETLEGR